MHHQLIEEAAYFHWINRGRPIGDPWADWFAAEAEFADRVASQVRAGSLTDERLSRRAENTPYRHWLGQGRPVGNPQAD